MAMTASATQPSAHELELAVADAGGAEVSLDAAVTILELREDAEHRAGRRRGDPPDPLALRLRSRLREPRLVPRSQPLLAEGVVDGDLRVVDAGDVKQKRDDQAGAILAAHAMHDDGAVRRARDRSKSGGDVPPEALEEHEVHSTGCRSRVGRSHGCGFDFGERLLVVVEERKVEDIDRNLC